MSAILPFCFITGVKLEGFSRQDHSFLEASLLAFVCDELKTHFKTQHHSYFQVLNFNKTAESIATETMFVRQLIQEILATEEYSIQGIAYYTGVPIDAILELASGYNANPSFALLRRILELHRLVKPSLYQAIIQKFIANFGERAFPPDAFALGVKN